MLHNTCSIPVNSLMFKEKKIIIWTCEEWKHPVNGSTLVARFQHNPFLQFRFPFLLLCPSALIDAQKIKGPPLLAGQKRKAWLHFFLHCLSIANPTGILTQLSFPQTTAMVLDRATSLSFLLLCLKIMPTVYREGNLRKV